MVVTHSSSLTQLRMVCEDLSVILVVKPSSGVVFGNVDFLPRSQLMSFPLTFVLSPFSTYKCLSILAEK